jgi:hypothetical protein
VTRLRSLLAHALAVLLFLQWIGAPAQCLAMAALDGAVICHAGDATPHQGGGPISPDQCCPACHALGHAALTPTPLVTPDLIAWSAPTPPRPRPLAGPTAPRAPPQQPRAPPARSV